jgi:O-antigen/teichoic acid export membrane protein
MPAPPEVELSPASTELGASAGHIRKDRRRILGGALWTAGDFWLQQMSQFLTFVVVGNILGPPAIGVMSMGLTAVLFAWAFLTGGFADALVQRTELRKDHFDTVFWLLMAIALIAVLILILVSPLLAGLFKENSLKIVLPLLSLSLPCVAVTATYQALVQRALQFKQLAIRSLVASTAGFAVALITSEHGWGVYSLVAYYLVARFLEAALLVLVTRRLPGIEVSRAAFNDVVGYGAHRLGNQVSFILLSQVPRVIIGAFLGSGALGLYSIVERILIALQNGISGVIARVAFPTLSGRQGEQEGFFRAMRDFITAANVVMLPIFIGLSLTAHEAIATLMTATWIGAAPLLSILCLGMIVQPTFYVLHTASIALGHSRAMARLGIANLLLCFVATLIAQRWGLAAIAWATVGVNFTTVALVWGATHQYFRARWLYLLGGLPAPALATLAMAVVIFAVSPWLLHEPVLLAAAIKVGLGVLTYLGALRVFGPRAFRSLFQLLLSRHGPEAA